MGDVTVLAVVAMAGVIYRDPRRRLQPGLEHSLILGDQILQTLAHQAHHLPL